MRNEVVTGMPMHEYLADPCDVPSLSSHIAQRIVSQSPAHAYHFHPRLGGNRLPPEEKFDTGNAVHSLLLGAGPSIATVQIREGDDWVYPTDWRKKAAKEARDEIRAAGKIPMLQRQWEKLERMAWRIGIALDKRGIKFDGMSEVTILWTDHADDGTPVQCRSRLDHVWMNDGLMVDLKTCANAHPKRIERVVGDLGYNLQAHAYTKALISANPKVELFTKFLWVFAETGGPNVVTLATPSGGNRGIAATQWRQAVNTWAQCLQTGQWPGYSEEVVQIEPTPWAMTEAASAGMTDDIPFGGEDDAA